MPAYSASAPGKLILFGEHAVVYGRPAIAVPVLQVRAKAIANADPRSGPGHVKLRAPDIGLETTLTDLPQDHPGSGALEGCCRHETKPYPILQHPDQLKYSHRRGNGLECSHFGGNPAGFLSSNGAPSE